jgi:hypothetical protein
VALTVLTATDSAQAADAVWLTLGSGTTEGISGLAHATGGWVLVRDNKIEGQNRVSLLSSDFDVTPLKWPGADPIDLEAIAAVPGSSTKYVVLTSSGSGWLVATRAARVRLIRPVTVPRGTAGIESFALTRAGKRMVAVWATRGSPTDAANVYAATFQPATAAFGPVTAGTVEVTYPVDDVRHVADLAIVNGSLIGSATADPGNDGPFSSAVYGLGEVRRVHANAVLELTEPALLATYDGHKIEGIACSGTTSLMGTDDENLGGAVAVGSFCG